MRYRMLAVVAAVALVAAGCSASTIAVPRYVLSYGVGDYPPEGGNSGDLHASAIDAQAMRSLLVSEGYADHYSNASSGACINSSVTNSRLRNDILGLDDLEDDSIIVIFYTSHGTYDNRTDTSYLVPYDAVDASGYITPATEGNLISPSELGTWIAQSGKKNVIVIINTCYSGGFVDSGSSIDTAPENYGQNDWGTTNAGAFAALGKFGELLSMNARDSREPGPIVISACGSNESAYENPTLFGDNGVFPFFLLDAADHGDANGDGFVTATEAYVYAVTGIKYRWNLLYYNYYNPGTGPGQIPPDENQGRIYIYPDFMPHISGGGRDLVLFSN